MNSKFFIPNGVFAIIALNFVMIHSIKAQNDSRKSLDTLVFNQKKVELTPFLWVDDMPYYDECRHIENNEQRHSCVQQEIQTLITQCFKISKEDFKKVKGENILVSFVVGVNGEIEDVEIIKGINDNLNQEAVRCVLNLPSMIPGTNLGEPVRVKSILPLKFGLK